MLASEAAVSRLKLKPLARLVGYAVVGVEPSIMGIGPAHAIRKLLQQTKTTLNSVDLVEVCGCIGGCGTHLVEMCGCMDVGGIGYSLQVFDVHSFISV